MSDAWLADTWRTPGLCRWLERRKILFAERIGATRALPPFLERQEEHTQMANPVSVSKFEVKSHSEPDEVRKPERTLVEVVRLEGFTLGRFTFEPGWRWSDCVKPVVKTESCQASHVGYVVAGRLTVQMSDGTQKSLKVGDAYTIPPGCLLYTSPSPRDRTRSRMPSSA